MQMIVFFNYIKKLPKKIKINVVSFGIKNQKADIKLINIKTFGKKFKINIDLNNKKKIFYNYLTIFKTIYIIHLLL